MPQDVLVVGQVAEPRSLDPHVTTSLNDHRILANLYDGLVRFSDEGLAIEPALARAWEVSDDGLAYTFHLRREVRFHDGALLDAEAVRQSFARMLDPDHPLHGTGPFPLAFFFERVREIEALDAHTVRFHLDRPFAPLLANLAYPPGWIVSVAALREPGRDFGRQPSGTGPFRFVRWDAGRRVVLERFEGGWHPPPRLRRVIFRPLTDPSVRLTELRAGEVDLLVEAAPEAIGALRADPGFTVHEAVGPHLWFLILEVREGPFADPRMRRAVDHAIDRERLVRHVLQGTAEPAAGPVPRAFAWADAPDVAPRRHDPERARALVRAAGHPEGVDVELLVPQSGSGMLDPVVMATAIQADLAEVGIRAAVRSYEWNTFLAVVNAGLEPGQMAAMAWMTNDPDTLPSLALRSDAWPERGGFNSGHYASPRVDALVARARTETDRERRGALYRELERVFQEDVPWAVVASWRQGIVTRARVKGFRALPSFFLDLAPVWKETP